LARWWHSSVVSSGSSSALLRARAVQHLESLCLPYPDRHVGGPGNAAANRLFAETAEQFGFEVTRAEFSCVVWEPRSASLQLGAETWALQPGPYSLRADVTAQLCAAGSVEELEGLDAAGSVLLLHGGVVREQLTPKNYPFYRWESHTRVLDAIEAAAPAVVISATGRSSELVGSLYPFPLIEDADFDVPHAFTTDVDGARLLTRVGESTRVVIESGRRESIAEQVTALKGSAGRRIVVSAHIDSRRGSPGAIDNGTGVVVLLLLAEFLAGHDAEMGVELVPFNGEDDYAAPGEVAYLAAHGARLADEVVLNINIDGAGWRGHDAEISLYECPPEIVKVARTALEGSRWVSEGDPWPQSDHMMFVMRGIPAIAVTTADARLLRMEIAHTEADVPEVADPDTVVAVANYIERVVHDLTR
jgi:aminopeptidase YwaD